MNKEVSEYFFLINRLLMNGVSLLDLQSLYRREKKIGFNLAYNKRYMSWDNGHSPGLVNLSSYICPYSEALLKSGDNCQTDSCQSIDLYMLGGFRFLSELRTRPKHRSVCILRISYNQAAGLYLETKSTIYTTPVKVKNQCFMYNKLTNLQPIRLVRLAVCSVLLIRFVQNLFFRKK